MFTPRTPASTRKAAAAPSSELPLQLASELAIEYASLRAPGNCPRGLYLTPSPETLLRWHGVFFVHRGEGWLSRYPHGPYASSVLRFTLLFPPNYPNQAPTIRFDSDVFHPLVEPKSKVFHPLGRLEQWQPRVHHVPHLLNELKRSFSSGALDRIAEDQAVNKQVWLLHRHSHQTFLAMTAQRAKHSASPSSIFPSSHPLQPAVPPSPTRYRPASPATPQRHQRTISGTSSASGVGEDPGPIAFKEMSEDERSRAWEVLKRSVAG